MKSGLDHIQAAEIANQTLFQGLHFSPYNLLVENDDYVRTAEYKLLYTELVSTIVILLEDEL